MVDVVFVLMLFFMACAGSQVNERELTVLPSGQREKDPQVVPPVPIIIEISPEGQVSMNNQVYGAPTDRNLNRLREWLVTAIEQFGADNPVIIHPQSDTRHERIVDVLNAAAAAKVKNLTFS